MALHEVSFLSYNERDTIKGWIYTPIVEPKGIVQIIHGFGEHSRRYMHMILNFVDAGYIVCADDHVGHGKTAMDGNTWGNFGDKGYMTTTEDEHTLYTITSEKFPNLPYFIFGHSWGSMIARNYVSHYGNELAGAICCGGGRTLDAALKLHPQLQELVATGHGDEIREDVMATIFEGTTDRYENPKTPNDWISITPEVVADHAADPFNNFTAPPNVTSWLDFTTLIVALTDENWPNTVPKNLPMYLIGGDQDPITNFGEGIYYVANRLIETGHTDISSKVYPGYRHEIHNEPTIRAEVEDSLVAFCDAHLA